VTLIALVTGASSGFGEIIARDLAGQGHIAYASMRDLKGKNAVKVDDIRDYANKNNVDLRSIECDVQSDESIAAAVKLIISDHGRIDVLVQNAGHMAYGPSEAFTPDQLAELYDINVIGSHRVNRAVLPHMRSCRSGLIVWVSSTSVVGGVPPLLGPYFAAKAGMDSLAVCYAKELAPFGIETSIVVPGAFTTGTNHFANAGKPEDETVADAYVQAYPDSFEDKIKTALAATVPTCADPGEVGRVVAKLVAMPFGTRPLRVFVDPANDGAIEVFTVMDRVRREFLHRIGYANLLQPTNGTETTKIKPVAAERGQFPNP
jgi:NAD(P)-dependent dehydrogenase (short-subunit alcohol dehydrogenase family)